VLVADQKRRESGSGQAILMNPLCDAVAVTEEDTMPGRASGWKKVRAMMTTTGN
jgi:hypothetical protein